MDSKIIIDREALYNTPNDSWSANRRELHEKGYTVIKGAISRERADHYRNEFWKWIEELTDGKVKQSDPESWYSGNWPKNSHGIFTSYGFGHTQWVWDARCEEGILKAFEELYNTKELLVSFDGGNASRPQDEPRAPWWHVDQNESKKGFYCIQGLLNLEECGPHDGGLVVYEHSHSRMADFFKDTGFTSKYSDYYPFKVDPRTLKWFEDCKEVKVCCEPGDLVLWDSRTIHWADAPLKKLGNGKTRMVTYICMQPKQFAKDIDLQVKKQALERNLLTTHWASENVITTSDAYASEGDDTEYSFKNNLKEKPLVLSERAKQLAGLVNY